MSSAEVRGSARVVRPITEDEKSDYWGLMSLAFNETLSDEQRDVYFATLGLDRTFAVFEDGEMVGTGGAFAFQLTVPGLLPVPAAGVTGITVRPTHRRRGVLSSMLREHLTGLHEAGDVPLSVLMASEPAIYGRFGYGLGTVGYSLAIPRSPQALKPVAGIDKFRIRMVDPETAYDACAAVYADAVASRPGMLARDGQWKLDVVADHDEARAGMGALRCVVAEAPDGSVSAYARYRTKDGASGRGRPGGKVRVWDVYGRDLASYAAVWRYLLDLDLTDEVLTHGRAVDDPIMHLLVDARAAQPELRDHLYARLVDVDKALAARRYSAPVDVVFEVSDPFCPWNADRFRLSGDASGAVCSRTTDPADLLLDVRELGSVHLGGISLAALGRAGLVEELTPGALRAVSPALLTDPAPFLPFGF
jgi:predicted acetyltransferase